MMVFAPNYENSMVGGNEFGSRCRRLREPIYRRPRPGGRQTGNQTSMTVRSPLD
jgi:hypothetical protein